MRASAARASSYAADAYKSLAVVRRSCAAGSLDARASTNPRAARVMSAVDIGVLLTLLCQIDRHAVGSLDSHDDRLPALAELRVAKENLVRANRQREVGERRLADCRPIHEDVGPGPRVRAQH